MAWGIDMGPSSGEQSQYGALTSAAGAATQTGESDLNSSSAFMQALLSGDSAKISQVLAPQISAAKTSQQQDQKTLAQNGTRSGGTAASSSAATDRTHANITNLIGSLTGSAASSLGSEGEGLLGMGMSGDEAGFGEAKTMQGQRAAKWNDLFNSIASTAGAVAGIPMGAPGAGISSGGGADPLGEMGSAPTTFGMNWSGAGSPSPDLSLFQ